MAWERLVFAQLIRGNGAFGASAVIGAGRQGLLGVVADEYGKDGVTSVPYPIAAHHGDPCFTMWDDQA